MSPDLKQVLVIFWVLFLLGVPFSYRGDEPWWAVLAYLVAFAATLQWKDPLMQWAERNPTNGLD